MRSSVIIATWELWAINRPGVLEVEIACTRSIRTVHRAKEAPRVLWHPAPHFPARIISGKAPMDSHGALSESSASAMLSGLR